MTEKLAPPWLQELLDAAEETEQQRIIEFNKIKADQALAAIAVLESKIDDVNHTADVEIRLMEEWNMNEVGKLQKQIAWLAFNLEKYLQTTGEKTLTLAHGKIQLRMGRDKVEVVDMDRFMTIGQRLGLIRVTPAKTEPDLLAIATYTKLNGKPPAGVMLTPGQPKFSYKTKGTNDVNTERNDNEQTEAGASARQTDQAHAA